MAAQKFIQKATANAHGQFRAKAQSAGMSTAAFAKKKAHAKGITGKQARLATTLMGMNHGKKKSASPMKASAQFTPPGYPVGKG